MLLSDFQSELEFSSVFRSIFVEKQKELTSFKTSELFSFYALLGLTFAES